MSRHVVRVDLPESPYDVVIQPGLLDEIGARVAELAKSKKVGIVSDSNTGPLYAARVAASLNKTGIDVTHATLPAGEAHKTLASLLPVYDAFLSARFERSTPILALGGGVVGDMTGFVAATLLRGVPFIQVPTTLLSMVDASVGGKTGVDHAMGKNLIGAFHQPKAVLIDPQVLTTLPPRELRSGLAECIKHDIIRDADGFATLERDIDAILAMDIDRLSALIAHNVAIKAAVVAADPFEHGERAHLNFGHTFGHAIESVSNYELAHGEAIALGMCAASYAAMKLNLIDDATRRRMVNLIARAQLPTSGIAQNVDAVMDAMFSDKKVKAGKLRFILPDGIGHVVIRDDLPKELIRDAVRSLQGD
jgi:3-dehydroquinate synthase